MGFSFSLCDLSNLPFRGRLAGTGYGAPAKSKKKRKKIERRVRRIFEQVQKQGDAAVRKYARKYDGSHLENFKIPAAEIKSGFDRVDPALRKSLELAEQRIRAHHLAQLERFGYLNADATGRAGQKSTGAEETGLIAAEDISAEDISTEDISGIRAKTRIMPLASAGVYVPGGYGKYPSSVLMNAIPAKAAGVERVIICTPPDSSPGSSPDSSFGNSPANSFGNSSSSHSVARVSDEILAAAWLAGVEEIYAVGGAQAIAAMAYGTDLIPRVDVLCGPGNDFVATAQKLAASLGEARVPFGYAGPSEIAVIFDSSANLSYLSLDLLAQMEHGKSSWAWAISWEEDGLSELSKSLEAAVNTDLNTDSGAALEASQANFYGVLVNSPEEAVELANKIAPEHLQIICPNAGELAEKVKNAGAIFCGDFAPTALGDYLAGPSHTLPTGGTARFAGALGVADFLKATSIISADMAAGTAAGELSAEKEIKNSKPEYKELAQAAAVIADAEGFNMHARSLRARLD